MSRQFALLVCSVAVALAPTVRADHAQNPPQGQSGQLPVIITRSSAAAQPPAGGNNLPTVTYRVAAAPAKPEGANRVSARYATVGDVLPLPCEAIYDCPASYGYWSGACCSPYGYGYGAYGLGYDYPPYNFGYNVAYSYWAQRRPLPTAIVHPAGHLSTMPGGNVLTHDGGFAVHR